tara:strand:- start:87 stop:290 length:204 start_codon:yes stop_codon:yes gene_type:complete
MNEDKYESIKADDKDHFDQNQAYYDFLDDMMDSGGSNMFQAPMMLRECFDLSKSEALKIFIEWKDTK